jgi:hypothetical protein
MCKEISEFSRSGLKSEPVVTIRQDIVKKVVSLMNSIDGTYHCSFLFHLLDKRLVSVVF